MSSNASVQPARQAWIHSPALDLSLIIMPAFVISICVLFFQYTFEPIDTLPVWMWVVLIMGIDVAHVYSTLFRSYLNPVEFGRQKALFTLVPIGCWLSGVMLYSISDLLFWRILAYIAVFHFVRQQYGFMAIYARTEPEPFHKTRWLDACVIYLAMLYPLAYWHTHLPRNFNWFMEGDFIQRMPAGLDTAFACLLAVTGLVYVAKEIYFSVQTQFFNIPKNLMILGTAFSWSAGIILFNNDLAFTATNVISHGIPYMALVWMYGRRATQHEPTKPIFAFLKHRHVFSVAVVPFFLLFLWGLAYLEEGFWDSLVWRDHTELFGGFSALPEITDHATLALLVPLLALPQITHYVLDGFIWRMRSAEGSQWASTLFGWHPFHKSRS